jgi:hypothetical protein
VLRTNCIHLELGSTNDCVTVCGVRASVTGARLLLLLRLCALPATLKIFTAIVRSAQSNTNETYANIDFDVAHSWLVPTGNTASG